VRVRLLGLQRDGAGLYGYGIGDLADFKLGIDTLNRIRCDDEFRGKKRTEAGGRHLDIVGAGLDVDEGVTSSVLSVLSTPVCLLVSVTAAPGITAPDGSVTVPTTDPYSTCAVAGGAVVTRSRAGSRTTNNPQT